MQASLSTDFSGENLELADEPFGFPFSSSSKLVRIPPRISLSKKGFLAIQSEGVIDGGIALNISPNRLDTYFYNTRDSINPIAF
jgi:hypothetical protein